jgi:hypothetical protein
VQTAWITHDRNREDPVNIEFYRGLTVAKENYIRYAVQNSQRGEMQALLERAAQRAIEIRARSSKPAWDVLQRDFGIRVRAMQALQRLIVHARSDAERLLNMQNQAAQTLMEAFNWAAAQTEGTEASVQAERCCSQGLDYNGHIDRNIADGRQLINDYHRQWQSYRETTAHTNRRRMALANQLPPVPPLVWLQAAQDERTYGELACSDEAPVSDAGSNPSQPPDTAVT